MLKTDDFIFIHAPKTGGTFITKILKELYPNAKEIADKHAYAKDIPKDLKSLLRLLSLREPVSWYESHYLYGWWRRYPETFPGFSKEIVDKLSFFDFVKKWNAHWSGGWDAFSDEEKSFGKLSYMTILYIFDEPKPVLEDILKNGVENFWQRHSLPKNLSIVTTENLNKELFSFLNEFKPKNELDKIFQKYKKRIRPEDDPRGESEIDVKKSQNLIKYINKRERILTDLLKNLSS